MPATHCKRGDLGSPVNTLCARVRDVEKDREQCARWYAANREKKLAYHAEWRAKNAAKKKAKNAEWYKRNKVHVLARTKEWRAANRCRVNAYFAKYRADRIRATPSWAELEIIELIYAEAHHRGLEVDHVVPLRGENVCGLHVHYNMQLLTRAENAGKRNYFK